MYVPIVPEPGPWLNDSGLFIGARVSVSFRSRKIRGTITEWGRDEEADKRFREIEAAAKREGRELTGYDYECLIDAEGPVVYLDNGETHWLPGQAMFCVEPVS
jgi:hypothetical protein